MEFEPRTTKPEPPDTVTRAGSGDAAKRDRIMRMILEFPARRHDGHGHRTVVSWTTAVPLQGTRGRARSVLAESTLRHRRNLTIITIVGLTFPGAINFSEEPRACAAAFGLTSRRRTNTSELSVVFKMSGLPRKSATLVRLKEFSRKWVDLRHCMRCTWWAYSAGVIHSAVDNLNNMSRPARRRCGNCSLV